MNRDNQITNMKLALFSSEKFDILGGHNLGFPKTKQLALMVINFETLKLLEC